MFGLTDVKLPLQVAINRENTRVLFAELDSDLADVLISFLTLPLGKIVKIFQKHYGEGAPVIGSLTTLYNGLANLDDVCFCTKECKEMLLDPKSAFSLAYCSRLKLNIDYLPTTTYFTHNTMEMFVNVFGNISSLREVFTKKNMSFTVSDDLQILSSASTFALQNAHQFGIKDVDGMSLETHQIGLRDVVELLKGLFVSQSPIAFLIKDKRRIMQHPLTDKHNVTVSSLLAQNDTKAKKYVVTAVLQKSMNKFLFLQANDDFADFIFSLLVVPLGAVARLLGGNTSIVCIDNLFRSIMILDKDCHLMEKGTKDLLLKLQHHYLSKKNILPLAEHKSNVILNGNTFSVQDPKGDYKCYISGPRKFIFNDDLTVVPSTMGSVLSQLNKMNVPISDTEEVELEIGMHQALSILRASLVSTTVLTDTLMPLVKKQPKQEYGV